MLFFYASGGIVLFFYACGEFFYAFPCTNDLIHAYSILRLQWTGQPLSWQKFLDS